MTEENKRTTTNADSPDTPNPNNGKGNGSAPASSNNNSNPNDKLTPEQRERLNRLRQDDRKNSKFVALEPEEDLNMRFDSLKITQGERNYKGNKTKTWVHMVRIPEWGKVEPLEKEFQLSPTWARDLWREMEQTGNTLFNVKREGSTAQDTKYTFTAIN